MWVGVQGEHGQGLQSPERFAPRGGQPRLLPELAVARQISFQGTVEETESQRA